MSDESTKNPHKTEEELVNRENHDNIEIEKKTAERPQVHATVIQEFEEVIRKCLTSAGQPFL